MTKKLLLLILCINYTLSLSAQLKLALSDISGKQGEVIEAGLSIFGFEEITSMQFSVNWDSTVLKFKSIDNLTDILPSFTEKEIGLIEASSGAIRVAWFDSAIQGVSLPDSTQLFTMQFEVIGAVGTNSNISISDSPIVIEFTNLDGTMIEIEEVLGGTVSIPDNSTSLRYVTAPNGMVLHQNEPNPFSNTTTIIANFPAVQDIQFYISDLAGRIVYQDEFKSVQGENTIAISRAVFNTPGAYYYTVQSKRYQLTKKMILLP